MGMRSWYYSCLIHLIIQLLSNCQMHCPHALMTLMGIKVENDATSECWVLCQLCRKTFRKTMIPTEIPTVGQPQGIISETALWNTLGVSVIGHSSPCQTLLHFGQTLINPSAKWNMWSSFRSNEIPGATNLWTMLQLSIGVPLWLWMPSEPPAVHAMDLRNQWPSQHQLGMLDIQLISGLIPDRSGITASLYLKDSKSNPNWSYSSVEISTNARRNPISGHLGNSLADRSDAQRCQNWTQHPVWITVVKYIND